MKLKDFDTPWRPCSVLRPPQSSSATCAGFADIQTLCTVDKCKEIVYPVRVLTLAVHTCGLARVSTFESSQPGCLTKCSVHTCQPEGRAQTLVTLVLTERLLPARLTSSSWIESRRGKRCATRSCTGTGSLHDHRYSRDWLPLI